jgi:hypothetical protein
MRECLISVAKHMLNRRLTREEWSLAQWLVKNLGQTQTDEFLKLPIVSYKH